jgi:hypothetical protein
LFGESEEVTMTDREADGAGDSDTESEVRDTNDS